MSAEQQAWISGLTVAKLKDELKKRGQPVGGLKAELVSRLTQFLQDEAKEPSSDQPQPGTVRKSSSHSAAGEDEADIEGDKAEVGSVAVHAKEAEPSTAPATDAEPVEGHAKDVSSSPAHEKLAEPSSIDAKEVAPSPAHAKDAPPSSAAPAQEAERSPKEPEPSAVHAKADQTPTPLPPPEPAAAVVADNLEAEVEEVDYGLDEPPAQQQPEEAPPAQPAAQQTAAAPSADEQSPQALAEKAPEPALLQPKPSLETAGSGLEEDKSRKRRAPIQFQPKAKQPAAATEAAPKAAALAAASTEQDAVQPLKVVVPAPAALERKVTAPSPLAQTGPALAPPAGPPTCAMRIDNLVRPFMEQGLRALLSQTGTIKDFWMPSIKTHAFVIMESEAEGEATCAALHGLAWPQSSPKRLVVTYLTEDEAQHGISSGRGDPGKPAAAPTPVAVDKRAAQPAVAAVQPAAPATAGRPMVKVGLGAVAAAKAAMAAAAGAAGPKTSGAATNNKRPRSASPLEEDGAAQAAAETAEAGDEPPSKRAHVERPDAADGPAEAVARDSRKVAEGAMEVDEPAEPEPLSLDTLFRKTAAKPPLYWLPLTEEQVKDKQYHEAKEAAEAAVLPHIDGLPPPPPSQQEFMQFNGGGRRAPRGNFYGGGR